MSPKIKNLCKITDEKIGLFVKILAVEIKGDEEIREPNDENKEKYKAAEIYLDILNKQQTALLYRFNFLTPEDYDYYFSQLRNNNLNFASKLDAELEKNGPK